MVSGDTEQQSPLAHDTSRLALEEVVVCPAEGVLKAVGERHVVRDMVAGIAPDKEKGSTGEEQFAFALKSFEIRLQDEIDRIAGLWILAHSEIAHAQVGNAVDSLLPVSRVGDVVEPELFFRFEIAVLFFPVFIPLLPELVRFCRRLRWRDDVGIHPVSRIKLILECHVEDDPLVVSDQLPPE